MMMALANAPLRSQMRASASRPSSTSARTGSVTRSVIATCRTALGFSASSLVSGLNSRMTGRPRWWVTWKPSN